MTVPLADRLLRLACDGRDREAESVIDALTSSSPRRVEAVAIALLRVVARAAADRTPPDEKGEPYTVEVFDLEGAELPIDDLGPLPRAAIRALLAVLADHEDEAGYQLRLILANGSRSDAVAVVSTCLQWAHDAG